MQDEPKNLNPQADKDDAAMTTIEQIKQMVTQHGNGITEVQVDPEGFVRAKLANEVDPGRPYPLIVHPVADKQVLRVWVFAISRARRESAIPKALAMANGELRCGRASMGSDGEVVFQINQVLLPGSEDQLAAGLLDRLLDEAVVATRYLARAILFYQMIDAGIPGIRAKTVIQTLFPKGGKDRGAGSATL